MSNGGRPSLFPEEDTGSGARWCVLSVLPLCLLCELSRCRLTVLTDMFRTMWRLKLGFFGHSSFALYRYTQKMILSKQNHVLSICILHLGRMYYDPVDLSENRFQRGAVLKIGLCYSLWRVSYISNKSANIDKYFDELTSLLFYSVDLYMFNFFVILKELDPTYKIICFWFLVHIHLLENSVTQGSSSNSIWSVFSPFLNVVLLLVLFVVLSVSPLPLVE